LRRDHFTHTDTFDKVAVMLLSGEQMSNEFGRYRSVAVEMTCHAECHRPPARRYGRSKYGAGSAARKKTRENQRHHGAWPKDSRSCKSPQPLRFAIE
jgi:hypothetical protein